MTEDQTRLRTWAERFAAMSQEDRIMTIAEDGSTLDALIKEARAAEALGASAPTRTGRALEGWQPIETAPKGSWLDGPDDVRDPAYVAPPHVWLLLPDKQRCVGCADAYYADGGGGYDGDSFWVEEFSGERVRPTHWMPLPPAPGVSFRP